MKNEKTCGQHAATSSDLVQLSFLIDRFRLLVRLQKETICKHSQMLVLEIDQSHAVLRRGAISQIFIIFPPRSHNGAGSAASMHFI